MQEDKKNLHQCKECGFHYKDKEMAEKCEAWCKEHKTCNVQITKQAEENQKQRGPTSLIEKQGECEKKCEEYLNNWKRAQADFENYKKEEVERISTLIKYAKEDMILNILPILDNIELAEKQLPEKLKKGEEGTPQSIEWTKGFLQIKKQIEEFLKKEGIEEIKAMGEKFYPETMEAVGEADLSSEALAKGEGGKSGIVIEELQKGYNMNGKVLRPAKVKISK